MDGSRPRFTAPTNQQELAARIDELRQHYQPFLRSLPPPLERTKRTALSGKWKFVYEAKKSPKTEGIPPAPAWHGRRIRRCEVGDDHCARVAIPDT